MTITPTPIVYTPMHPYTPPLPVEQQILAALLRIEKLLQVQVDNTRPAGTKAAYRTGK